jgi:hypothetical protein
MAACLKGILEAIRREFVMEEVLTTEEAMGRVLILGRREG